MRLARGAAARVAAFGLLAWAGLVVAPVAMQRSIGASRKAMNANGHPAVANEVL